MFSRLAASAVAPTDRGSARRRTACPIGGMGPACNDFTHPPTLRPGAGVRLFCAAILPGGRRALSAGGTLAYNRCKGRTGRGRFASRTEQWVVRRRDAARPAGTTLITSPTGRVAATRTDRDRRITTDVRALLAATDTWQTRLAQSPDSERTFRYTRHRFPPSPRQGLLSGGRMDDPLDVDPGNPRSGPRSVTG